MTRQRSMLQAIFVIIAVSSFATTVWGSNEGPDGPVPSETSHDSALVSNVVERFKNTNVDEAPDFQRHIAPLLGRLGCNGRACHGSFQGQGGFQLSLFGYDFKSDHGALLASEECRVDIEAPEESLILTKPTDEDNHEHQQPQ